MNVIEKIKATKWVKRGEHNPSDPYIGLNSSCGKMLLLIENGKNRNNQHQVTLIEDHSPTIDILLDNEVSIKKEYGYITEKEYAEILKTAKS